MDLVGEMPGGTMRFMILSGVIQDLLVATMLAMGFTVHIIVGDDLMDMDGIDGTDITTRIIQASTRGTTMAINMEEMSPPLQEEM